jgi:hypothetical protein
MNVLTQQLFEQLSQGPQVHRVQRDTDKAGTELPLIGTLTSGSTPGASGSPGVQRDAEEELAWKRDVLELLFMAPGMTPSSLPKVSHFTMPADHLISMQSGSVCESPTVATSPIPKPNDNDTEDAVVRYVPASAPAPAAETMSSSSAALLRALRELKRVDEILLGCSAFWANMDGTVQKLAQMKEHTECLVKFAANSTPLRERFEQRLAEYTSFWSSLERLCRQYCIDHHASSKRMYEVIREVADAADVMDTVQSARMGMMMAMRKNGSRAVVTRR